MIVGTGALVLAGGGVYAAERAGVLDDALRAGGVDPVPQPDPGDERRLVAVRTTLSGVLAAAEAQDSPAVAALVREQLDALGGADATATAPVPRLGVTLQDAADQVEAACLDAVSPDLAQVLASVSAGLLQARSLA